MRSCSTVAQLGEGQWTRNRTGAAWQPENCEAHIGDPCSALSAPAGSSKFVVMLGDSLMANRYIELTRSTLPCPCDGLPAALSNFCTIWSGSGEGQEKAQQYARQHPRPPECDTLARKGRQLRQRRRQQSGPRVSGSARKTWEYAGLGNGGAWQRQSLWRRLCHYGRHSNTTAAASSSGHRCSLPCERNWCCRDGTKVDFWNLGSDRKLSTAMVQANLASLRRAGRPPPAAVVVNVGAHLLNPLHSRESYAEDVRAYLALLGAVRPRPLVLWVSMASSNPALKPAKFRKVQSPRAIRDWNRAAADEVRAVGRDDVAFLDIWPLTKQVAHAWSLDGTHFADEVKHEENRLVLTALKLMSSKRE